MTMGRLRIFLSLTGLFAALPAAAGAQGRVEPVAGLVGEAEAIVAGPDGAMWASAAADPGRIARITPAGEVTYQGVGGIGGFPVDRHPSGLTSHAGALWFVLSGGPETFARVRLGDPPAGFALAYGRPTSLADGPDGALWMTVDAGAGRPDAITRFAAAPLAELPYTLGGQSDPRSIVAGPDGALWFVDGVGGRIGRITTSGLLTYRSVGAAPAALAADPSSGSLWYAQGSTVRRLDDPAAYATGSPPAALAAGPDGAVWAAVRGGATRIVPGEAPTTVTDGIDPAAQGRAIAAGPDGRMWMTLDRAPYLVKITVPRPITISPPVAPEAAANPTPAATPSPTPRSGPVEGKSVEVAVLSGTVSYRDPAQTTYTELKGSATLPLGVLLDTTDGKVRVASQVDGATQAAALHGGKFSVTQTSTGMTELALAGPLDCSASERAGISSQGKAKKKKKRLLWGKDSGGSFRTRGNGSVATVRGTEWRTEDTCAGTTVYVREGAVSVWPRRGGRSTLVRAGQRLFAPRPG
jgi:streptogramin lyase